MKKLLLLFVLIYALKANAQDTKEGASLDQLQAPASPAFNLLDISPNTVERPTNPTDFALSLSNASENFSVIPKNYAIEFAPGWLFNSKNITYQDFISDKNVWKNIMQTAIVSAGTRAQAAIIDTTSFYQTAFAIKFSVKRGSVGKEYEQWNAEVNSLLTAVTMAGSKLLVDTLKTDPDYQLYKALQNDSLIKSNANFLEQIGVLKTARREYLDSVLTLKLQETKVNEIEQLKKLAGNNDFERYGWKLDLAAGLVIDYPKNNWSNGTVSRFAIWATGGYISTEKLAGFGVLRFKNDYYSAYLNNDGVAIPNVNISSLDIGGRVFKDFAKKFTISFEYALRMPVVYNKSQLTTYSISYPENQSRYIFSLNYKVGKNQNISFTYGKSFETPGQFSGDLVAALNFMMGFGSTRPLN